MHFQSNAPDPGPASSQLAWRAMATHDLDAVVRIEQASHSHPWSRGNFSDSMLAGMYMPVLLQDDAVVGYLVAMPGVEEAHLLNVTVLPQRRGHGLGTVLMQALALWATRQRAQHIWLEVRESNHAAQALYRKLGYQDVAVRKHYYPLSATQREHALVMRKHLTGVMDATGPAIG